MSGGSFLYNYLCLRDASDLFAHVTELRNMREALAARGDAKVALTETDALLKMYDELEQRIARLRPVWRAVEWVDTCDWSEDQLVEALSRLAAIP